MPRDNITYHMILLPASANLSSVQMSSSFTWRNLFLKLAVVREDCLALLGDSLELFIQVLFIDIWIISKINPERGKDSSSMFIFGKLGSTCLTFPASNMTD